MNGESSSSSSSSYSDRRRRRFRLLTSSVALTTAAVAMVASLSGFLFTEWTPRLSGIQMQFFRDIDILKKEMTQAKTSLTTIGHSLDAIKNLPPESKSAAQIASLGAELKEAESRLGTLEAGLLDSPENALSVPLLRRDVENMKSNIHKDSELYAKQIDRIYDQNKWFLGLMFTMAIGMIGLAVSNFVQLRRPQESEMSNN